MGHDLQVDGLVNDEVQHLEVALLETWEADDLACWLLSLRQGNKAEWVRESLHLFDQFEGDKVENERLLVQHDNHHILAKFHVVDDLVLVEGDLGALLLFVIIPDDNLVALLLEDEHDDVCLVHHLNKGDGLAELHLLFQLGAARIILDDLKAFVSGNGEIFLSLISGNGVHRRVVRVFLVGRTRKQLLFLFLSINLVLGLSVSNAELLHILLVNQTGLCLYNEIGVLHFILYNYTL